MISRTALVWLSHHSSPNVFYFCIFFINQLLHNSFCLRVTLFCLISMSYKVHNRLKKLSQKNKSTNSFAIALEFLDGLELIH